MKTLRLLILWVAAFLVGTTSCVSDKDIPEDETCTLVIASKKIKAVDPVSSMERDYLAVKTEYEGKSIWSPHEGIVGFVYEEGFEYTLLVRKSYYDPANIPQDASSFRYIFVEILSKERKDSEGIN